MDMTVASVERESDGPWELPEGWVLTRLGAVLPIAYGKALPDRDRSGSGEYPVFGSSGAVGSHNEFIAPANSIMVGRKGSAGSVFLSETPAWPIDTAYFTSGCAAIDIRYGYWYLWFRKLGRLDQSTAIPSLSRDIYDVQPIPLAPLAEQRRIVARVDALFAEIAEGEAALEAARKGLDTFRRALLKAAVTGELTKDWRENNPITEIGRDLLARIRAERTAKGQAKGRGKRSPDAPPLDTATLPELPEGWAWGTLGEIAFVSTGGTPSRNDESFWRNGTIPWFTSAATNYPFASTPDEWITPAAIENSNCRVYPIGTLLVAMYGEGKTRGQITELRIPATCNQACAALQITDIDVREWVKHWFRAFYLQLRAQAAGGVQPNLNLEIIKSLNVPIPPPAESAEILRRVSDALGAAADTLTMLDAEAADAARLKQSILKAAFEGRLVPQDPADEPASATLARLKATPSTATPPRRGRRAKS